MSAKEKKKVAVLGSTGSIGLSTLDVIAANPQRYDVVALSAHANLERLLSQAREWQPRWVIASDDGAAGSFDWSALPPTVELVVGGDSLDEIARAADVDIVVAAIVGSAGLSSTLAALAAGKTVALANKEALVMAGRLVMDCAQTPGACLLPVDSEHSAIFQALQAGRSQDVQRIVLTASGGAFRNKSPQELLNVTTEDALAHPTWEMGPKITIDSATMMNKALEIIEARWLFDVSAEQVDVVLHPQSFVHSFVEFVDGSIVAQLGPPDMKLPIQYALSYPERHTGAARRLDWRSAWKLEFQPPDPERFPALELGYQCARAGGSSGAVLNAANEAAVEAFLNDELHFTEIVPACQSVLESHHFEPSPSLEDLIKWDRWAREEVSHWACA